MKESKMVTATASTTPLSLSQTRAASTTLALLSSLRDAMDYPELPAQVALTFLSIATSGEPQPILSLTASTGMSIASASRIVQELGRGKPGKPGRGLVVTEEDPTNYSRKLVKLSTKGHAVIVAVAAAHTKTLRTPQ